jgi:ABC-2 type transport system ATP-binding protein
MLEAQGFYPNLTGAQNLALSQRLLGLHRREVARVLALVELSDDADRPVADYSLGMRQRLGIARALLGSPALLVLDEPTNGLDPDGIAAMRRFIAELPARTGATVILSSHLLDEIARCATHIGIMHEGHLKRQGRLADLNRGEGARLSVRSSRADAVAQCLAPLGPVRQDEDEVVLTLPASADGGELPELCARLIAAGLPFTEARIGAAGLEALYRDAIAAPVEVAA